MENLGRHGRDVITGFEGTITSLHVYLTGCNQYGIQPKAKADGSVGDTMYFDETRVEISGEKASLVGDTNVNKGCDFREKPNK